LVADLVNHEWDNRQNVSIARLIKQVNFRYQASIEGLDYSVERGFYQGQERPFYHRQYQRDRYGTRRNRRYNNVPRKRTNLFRVLVPP
jgi:hypothetical protein